MEHADLIVVGAGILGAFHAFHASRMGLKTILLEKDLAPQEATVRNFGQVVPSGMPQGQWQQFGIESTRTYKELQNQFDISVRHHGSVYLASDAAEYQLLAELHEINRQNQYPSELLSPSACRLKYPALTPSYCTGGLFFPDEVTVEPRTMIHQLLAYLQEQFALSYHPLSHVIACEATPHGIRVEDHNRVSYLADKVVICSGREFKSLYPQVFYHSDIEVAKLQMMQTYPQPEVHLPGSILTGLTIRRYESFQECPSFGKLDKPHVASELSTWGIHILFKQARDGSIIIGDSHEYQDAQQADTLGFDIRSDINDLILQEAQRILDLPSWAIQRTWAGFYAQCKEQDILLREVEPNIHIVTAIGGKGMTGSPGFARAHIQALFGSADSALKAG